MVYCAVSAGINTVGSERELTGTVGWLSQGLQGGGEEIGLESNGFEELLSSCSLFL